jgi:hypothetical protein
MKNSKIPFPVKNFFRRIFFATFSSDLKSALNSAFFYTHFNYCERKILFGHISTFANFDAKRAQNGKKTENGFCKCVLEFNFEFMIGSGLFAFAKIVKIVVPNIHFSVSSRLKSF